MTEIASEPQLTDTDIVKYLKRHPQFFENHPSLLKKLHLQHESGNAISLIERQNEILRKDNRGLIDRLNQFIDVAQRNDRLFIKLQSLVLELIACRTLNEISNSLNQILTERFDVDDVQLVFTHQTNSDGDTWLHCDASILNSAFPGMLEGLTNQCGEFTETARKLLFAETAIRSMAIGTISLNGEGIGLLALGSHSASHFRSGTDTLFLGHLVKVISQLLVRF